MSRSASSSFAAAARSTPGASCMDSRTIGCRSNDEDLPAAEGDTDDDIVALS
jgi:hypothetical protein